MAKHIFTMRQVNVYNTLSINTIVHLMQELLNIAGHETLVQIEYDDYDVHHTGVFHYPYLVFISKGTKMLLQVHFKSDTNIILPHTAPIKNIIRHNINELHINLGNKLFHCDLGYEVIHHFENRTGRSFHQLTRCLQLQVLHLKNINLYHIQENKCEINTLVHTIHIKKEELNLLNELEYGLEKISKYFIHLKNIQLNITIQQQYKISSIKIKMLYNTLENTSWKVNNSTLVLLFVHKIINSSKIYFLFTRHDVCEIQSQDFQYHHFNEPTLKLEIQCHSLKSFTVQYHNIYQRCIL